METDDGGALKLRQFQYARLDADPASGFMLIVEYIKQVLKSLVRARLFAARFAIGLITLLGVMLIGFTRFVPQVTLHCDPIATSSVETISPQFVCGLTSSSLGHENTQSIEQLQRAEVDIGPAFKGAKMRRVMLIANNQKIPLTQEYVNSPAIHRHVDQINTFINHPGQSSLSIHEDHRWVLYLVGAFLAIIGAFFWVSRKVLTCIFDYLIDQVFKDLFRVKPQDDLSQSSLQEETGG